MPRPQPTQSSGSVASDRRREQREMFALVLRSEPNKRGVPFSERTIGSYLDAVDSLARWMDEVGHPGGFDELTVAQLNAYLATYLERHAIGGLVSKQGNLRSFLQHLAAEYGSDDLWPTRAGTATNAPSTTPTSWTGKSSRHC